MRPVVGACGGSQALGRVLLRVLLDERDDVFVGVVVEFGVPRRRAQVLLRETEVARVDGFPGFHFDQVNDAPFEDDVAVVAQRHFECRVRVSLLDELVHCRKADGRGRRHHGDVEVVQVCGARFQVRDVRGQKRVGLPAVDGHERIERVLRFRQRERLGEQVVAQDARADGVDVYLDWLRVAVGVEGLAAVALAVFRVEEHVAVLADHERRQPGARRAYLPGSQGAVLHLRVESGRVQDAVGDREERRMVRPHLEVGDVGAVADVLNRAELHVISGHVRRFFGREVVAHRQVHGGNAHAGVSRTRGDGEGKVRRRFSHRAGVRRKHEVVRLRIHVYPAALEDFHARKQEAFRCGAGRVPEQAFGRCGAAAEEQCGKGARRRVRAVLRGQGDHARDGGGTARTRGARGVRPRVGRGEL